VHLTELLALREAAVDDRLAELAEHPLGHRSPFDAAKRPGLGGRCHVPPPLKGRLSTTYKGPVGGVN
jgi:hypothetical protein